MSPAVTIKPLSTKQSLVLGFYQWFQFGGPDPASGRWPSFGDIEVRVAKGSSWGDWQVVSRQIGDLADGATNGSESKEWTYSTVDLSYFAGSRIQIGFHMNAGIYTGAGWFIDDVSLATVADMPSTSTITFDNFSPTNQQGWGADGGMWGVGTPTGGPKPHSGAQCAGAVLSGGYGTDTDSRFISPAVTLPNVSAKQSLVFGFYQWFQFGGPYAPNGGWPSYGNIEVRVANGSSWGGWQVVSRQIGDLADGATNGSESKEWTYSTVDLSAFAGSRIQIGFHIIGGLFTGAGWFIDDVSLATVADMPYNSTITFDDFSPTNQQGWGADGGMWGVGTPTGGPKPHSGTQCAGAVLSGGYGTDTDSRFISPAVTLPYVSSSESLSLAFYQWFQFGGPYAANGGWPSYGQIEVSTWTTGTWSNWLAVGSSITGTSDWSQGLADLTPFAGKRIRVAFHMVGGINSGAGWFIDDVMVIAPRPHILSYTPPDGIVGTNISIRGSFLRGASNVQFSGPSGRIKAPFTIAPGSDSLITTTVPTGAISGPIYVTAPGGPSQGPSFTVDSINVKGLAFSPTSVSNGMTSTGTITLVGSAASSVTVSLTSSDPSFIVPASVNVSPGATSVTFTGTASPVNLPTIVTVTAKSGTSSATGTVTNSPWLLGDSVSPQSVTAGSAATLTVTLNNPAPSGGLTVALASDNAVAVPSSTTLSFATGVSTLTVPINTFACTSNQTANLSATSQGITVTCKLTVTPGGATVTLIPSTVYGGQPSTGFVTLSTPAPAGGLTVSLASSDASTTVPPSVLVAAGQETSSFPIKTTAVSKTVAVTITATLGTAPGTAVLTVKAAPAAGYLQIIPNPVKGGNNAVGLLTLNGNAPASDLTFTVSSSNVAIGKPDSTVTVSANSNTGTFNIQTSPVTVQTTVSITVKVNGQSVIAKLIINP